MNDDDVFTSRLVAYQEARDRGDEQSADPSEVGLSPEDSGKLQRARECIDLLASLKGVSKDEKNDSNRSGSNSRTRRVGRFELVSELGAGGFGIVYLAWDPSTERHVALKIPRLERLISRDMRERFEQEARLAARLDHPHIATLLEAGVDGDLPYFTSVYYPGTTLATWLANRGSCAPERSAAELIRCLAEAAQHAHDRGVLHRDIKPSNILLAAPEEVTEEALDLERATPKLLDFGLGKLIAETRNLTQTGTPLGTWCYMPPEQAAGRAREIGPASDVYALGAVLYELLSGKPPFDGATDYSILQKIEFDEPTRIRALNSQTSSDLETICLKCLEKRPERRYVTARELAQDLDRFLEGEPIQASPAGKISRIWKIVRRRPSRPVIALLLIGVFAISLFAGNLSRRNHQLLGLRRTILTTNPPGAEIAFVPIDQTTGEPDGAKAIHGTTRSPLDMELPGGEYLVVAVLAGPDGRSRFHEVIRRIPREMDEIAQPTVTLGAARFSLRSDGAIELQPITIPEERVLEGMAPIYEARTESDAEPLFWMDVIEFSGEMHSKVREGERHDLRVAVKTPHDALRVNYYRALELAEAAGKRLPSFAEYELAARYVANGAAPSASSQVIDGPTGVPATDRLDTTPPVYGLFTNVAEWTTTRVPYWNSDPSRAGARVVWGVNASLIEGVSQDTTFAGMNEATVRPWLGFRCVRSARPRFMPDSR